MFGEVILILFGILAIAKPEFLSNSWKYKDVEPSDAAIFFTKLIGLILIIFSLIRIIFY
ncbi:DUF6199 family natural product biosynthesis protein [Abyssisolibacter fermentans]|uniref:DUF6199 family natural product biosynthesis protein n=1 Tax=Abyssisolibacter fermentans TaxID=1766203 RepID=UPI0012E37A9A|nr:hypothetical protein [Abyssisolibacter fermentans]